MAETPMDISINLMDIPQFREWRKRLYAEIDAVIEENRRLKAREICGVMSASGRNGELLACAFAPGHDGPHAWASLPTFVDGKSIEQEANEHGTD